MQKLFSILIAGASVLFGGCARTPDVEMAYYLPRADLALKAIRTVGCDADQRLHSAAAITAVTTYARSGANTDRKTIKFKALDGDFSNTDWGISYYDDGRLKGVNATTTGKGDEIIKTAIQVGDMIIPGLHGGEPSPELCQFIAERAPKEKLLTLVYTASESFSGLRATSKPMTLEPGHNDSKLEEFARSLDPLCVNIGTPSQEEAIASFNGKESDYVMLELREPARAAVSVVERKAGCTYEKEPSDAIWAATVLVPQHGKEYKLPMPKAALFGKQSFEAAFAESGALTQVKYGKETGASGLLGVVNTALTTAEPDSAAARAAEIKGQADLIAQQQRLIGCKIDPENCE